MKKYLKIYSVLVAAFLVLLPFAHKVQADRENDSSANTATSTNIRSDDDDSDSESDENEDEGDDDNGGSSGRGTVGGKILPFLKSHKGENATSTQETKTGLGAMLKIEVRHDEKAKLKVGGDDEKGLNKRQIVEKRFDWAVTTLTSLYSRLGTVITRLETAGFDMSKAVTAMIDAKTKVDLATTKANELNAFVITVKGTQTTATSTPSVVSSADAKKIKDMAKIAKEAAIDAHKALMSVRQEITLALSIDLNSAVQ
jgi:hypothetical protein